MWCSSSECILGKTIQSFDFFFEHLLLRLSQHLAVKVLAKKIKMHDTQIWRVIKHYVDTFWSNQDWYRVKMLGINETASKRGHNYITTFVDMEENKVLFATEGKDSSTIKRFVYEMMYHGANPSQITHISTDMSPAFISGVNEYFPYAILSFDKFHVIQLFNKAEDYYRINELKINPLLKGTRYIWLKNHNKLTLQQLKDLKTLSKENSKTTQAYKIKQTMQDIYRKITNEEQAYEAINKLISWLMRSRIKELKEVAKMLKKYMEGIINFWDSGLTNGSVESINAKIQEARRRAKGYKNISNFITMVYLIAGKLPLADIVKQSKFNNEVIDEYEKIQSSAKLIFSALAKQNEGKDHEDKS
jgi:transposase